MKDKIRELDGNIARLRELIKEDRRPHHKDSLLRINSFMDTSSNRAKAIHDSGLSRVGSEVHSGERKRKRTGSDNDDDSGNAPVSSLSRGISYRRRDSSSSEADGDGASPFEQGRSISPSPVSKRRHLASNGQTPAVGTVASMDNSVRGGLGFHGAGKPSSGLGAHPGLGSTNFDGGDVFANYRRQRSTRYHKAIAAAFQAKMGPGSDDKLCYICHQPGHFAKHCKFGIS